jgi:geranylgeranyl diphosphate synthase, type II
MQHAARPTHLDFDASLQEKAGIVNETLQRLLDEQTQIPPRLAEAMRYTLSAPGKRIRSALVMWCCELVADSAREGGRRAGECDADARIAAAAIEMVHTYSLVHDDLPAMDDDDLRRGRPTCHKAFDEATAILAGDGLLTLAFEILADRIADPALGVSLIRELAQASGPAGMIAGQVGYLQAENTTGDVATLEYIHVNKTAKMFRCAAVMGGLCGRAATPSLAALSEYGLKIGLGFQIADDILDVSASSEQLGKTAGKDVQAAKCTYPAVVGIEESKRIEQRLADEAVAALKPFGTEADILRQLAVALLERNR